MSRANPTVTWCRVCNPPPDWDEVQELVHAAGFPKGAKEIDENFKCTSICLECWLEEQAKGKRT